MQKIVLFIEPQKRKCDTPLKIGNLFMNRFGIDEDGSHEIMKIYHFQNTSIDYYLGKLTKNEGTDRILQQNFFRTWKLNSGTKLSCKQQYEIENINDLETRGGHLEILSKNRLFPS